jgi:hypothetical protein
MRFFVFTKNSLRLTTMLDEIAERRAIAEKYGIDVERVDGKNLVHIMSQQGYSLNGFTVKDWCVIDPK